MFGRELKILFWNLNRKELHYPLAVMAKEQRADIIIVAEAENLDKLALLEYLNTLKLEYYDANEFSLSERILFFTKFEPKNISPISEDDSDRYSIRKIYLSDNKEIIIGGVHLLDQKNYSTSSRLTYASRLKDEIDKLEVEHQIKDSIIIGDFNMNPFEQGMSQANGLNATSTRDVARRISTTILNKEYSFFYNPSWAFMGDLHEDVAGTYYYNKSGFDAYYWNVFDQVIIRPTLIENFDNQSYKVITQFENKSLLNKNGRPDKTSYSDHLPIILTFKNL